MARQHRELQARLEDAEKLWLYAGSATSKHWALKESLCKAKEGTEKVMGVEKERDEAKEEAQVAWLADVITGNAKAKAEGDLAKVQDALEAVKEVRVAVEEARHKTKAEVRRKAEAEAAYLEVKRMSLLLEIGTTKDEVSSLHSQSDRDKKAMEEDYQKALEVIFCLRLRMLCFQTQHM